MTRPKSKKAAPLCLAPTKAGGECQATRPTIELNGKKYRLKTCLPHASKAIQEKFGWPNRSGSKPQSAAGILRKRFEEDADRYLKPLEEAIEAMKAVVVGNGGSARIEMVEDFQVRLRAVETILDRIYGRPRQSVEHTGTDGAPMEVSIPQSTERELAVAKILAETGALGQAGGTIIPPNASASAPTTN